MATFLDISILSHFVSVFTFLLVFVIVFGMLEVFKVFGEGKKGLHAIIGVSIGLIFMFSSGVTAVIQTFMPWFTILILVIFFILFAVRMFGVSQKDISESVTEGGALTWILIFTAVIVLFSLGAGFGQKSLQEGPGSAAVNTTTTTQTSTTTVNNQTVATGSTSTGDFNQNLYNTIYHPKVLGLILIMVIVILAMLFLTVKED